ncbi:hypothetical protein N7495_010044 [Penicillium taxi]|uniref:uncharacterized protein n=1 Tax=Penicillium taxi TaxID=168475 RepID=UPI00254507CB|nr:uncharacterized protein N7495_010044 [Penicillium taxi]KAJ5885534.1 hypothetical protein N7495_010044 [Penicillium taxi]
MKFSSVVFALFALASTGLADKTCTPSFDYCSDVLLKSKGFTEADLEAVINGTDLQDTPVQNVLYHCTNPGQIGHPKLCSSGCKDPATEGSHGCDA